LRSRDKKTQGNRIKDEQGGFHSGVEKKKIETGGGPISGTGGCFDEERKKLIAQQKTKSL